MADLGTIARRPVTSLRRLATGRARRRRAVQPDRLPAWVRELAREVWTAEQLPGDALPAIRLGKPARSTRGYYSPSRGAPRIVVRRHGDLPTMRNTLLHELAHAVHRLHCVERARCGCEPRCTEDGHGAMFKRHLARIEHRHQPGTHSRWGLAGCLGRARVPARTPWHAEIPCARAGALRARREQAPR